MASAFISEDSQDFATSLNNLFLEKYDSTHTIIKSTRNADAVLHRGYYYNHHRKNIKSTELVIRISYKPQ